jgi:hypothetical protein
MRRRRRGDRRGEEPSLRVRVGRFGAARMSAVVTPLVLRGRDRRGAVGPRPYPGPRRGGVYLCLEPGLRRSAELDSTLAETIRSQFDAVFAVAHEPALRSASPCLGASYRQAQVTDLSGSRDPFSVDPALVERGLQGHTDTQNELASVLRNAGIEPRSCLPPEPNFDLAWQKNETVFVAEVKSITADNEESQLRLGLGHVLRYRQRLSALGHDRVVAALVPERRPRGPSWRELAGPRSGAAMQKRARTRACAGYAVAPACRQCYIPHCSAVHRKARHKVPAQRCRPEVLRGRPFSRTGADYRSRKSALTSPDDDSG